MAKYDPNDHKAQDVLKQLEKSSPEEQQQILAAERGGQARVTILEAYGIDPDERVDASGRVLYPWEVKGDDQVVAVKVDEDAEARKAREAQAEFDEKVAAAAPTGFDEQQGGTAAGVGVAAGGVATAPATTTGGTTTGTTGGTTGVAGGTATPAI